jgi:hypothetical protein
MATVKKSETSNTAPIGGPGCPPGTRIEGALESGDLMPLDFMLAIMRDECSPLSSRFEAAKAAAPYCHPKLASIQHSESVGLSYEESLKQLLADDEELLKQARSGSAQSRVF